MQNKFWDKADKLQAWHAGLVNKAWLHPLKTSRFVIAISLLSCVVAAGMSWYVRDAQYDKWDANREVFYLQDGMSLFTTADAPYWLGMAQSFLEDGDINIYHNKRHYPNIEQQNIGQSAPGLRDVPLLVVLISYLSDSSDPKDLLAAAHQMVPISALLSALMIAFAFGAAGYWIEGAVAAAGAVLSAGYFHRSGAGRIDTDQLNLGFFYLVTGVAVFAAKARRFSMSMLLAAVAGLAMWFFDWWYPKPVFGWAVFGGLLWLSFASSRDYKRVALQGMLFLVVSGLFSQGIGFAADNAYFKGDIAQGNFIFPNAFNTITELKSISMRHLLVSISGAVWLGIVGVVGVVFWAIRHPAHAVVFAPAASFALLNFVIGKRAIFYSAPMIWFGIAWLVLLCGRVAFSWAKNVNLQRIGLLGTVAFAFVVVWHSSTTEVLNKPTFDASMVSHFRKLGRVLPRENSVIATWWDYGYLSIFMNGLPTLHDGGSQANPTTYFVANSLVVSSQEESSKLLKSLGNFGYKKVLQDLSPAPNEVQKVASEKEMKDDVYLVLTRDMFGWMRALFQIGAWDIQKGAPYEFAGVKEGAGIGYQNLSCTGTDVKEEFLCGRDRVNTKTGAFGSRAVLERIVTSKNGNLVGGRAFENSTMPVVLQSESRDAIRQNFLMHRDLFQSVYHQLFFLNQPNPAHFELVYDGYPDMRVFKVR